MAVYKRSYHGYAGAYTPEWSRFLILTRYALSSLFAGRAMIGLFIACLIPFLIAAIMIYLDHSSVMLALFKTRQPFSVDGSFFKNFLLVEISFAYLLTAFIGPGLVSPDLTNNALVLYFCRPFTRIEYALGKIAAIAAVLSAVTWIPGLVLFGIETSMSGAKWAWDNLFIAGAILAGSWTVILLLAFLALALSAWVRWKPVAGALVMGIIFLSAGFGAAVKVILRNDWGNLLSIPTLIQTVCHSLFRLDQPFDLTPAQSWIGLFVISGACLWLLSRKLRAYQVVK